MEARVPVEISPDNIGETADKAEAILRSSGLPVFNRGGSIVRAGLCTDTRADGYRQPALIAQALNVAGLGEAFESVISFRKYDARISRLKPVHAPDLLLKTVMDRGKLSGLQPLTGLTDIPLVRPDGTLLDTPGYDEMTGIYYQPSGVELDIADEPTREDAQDAISTLSDLIRDFPFSSEVDRAAAISAFLSAVSRPTLGPTPMHGFTAPTPGSGKSLLASLVTIVATGAVPSFITQGETDEELEKRISAQMLEGRKVINLDNCNRPLKGAAICNLLTSERVLVRILGLSKVTEITSTSFMLVNGNNLRMADDMVRRTVICRIDPDMERPEERVITWDAKEEATRNRGRYVSACLTLLLAFQRAGAPGETTPLGSFEDWSRRVRGAIIWAGLPDPCANAPRLRDADPEKERFLAVAEQWNTHFGSTCVKVADVIIKANTPIADLRAALITVAGAGHEISANRLAAFLSRYADRPMEGFKFTSRKAHAGTKLWQLQA